VAYTHQARAVASSELICYLSHCSSVLGLTFSDLTELNGTCCSPCTA
jgi:hypothetical protein